MNKIINNHPNHNDQSLRHKNKIIITGQINPNKIFYGIVS
jgi:hypothetical protein